MILPPNAEIVRQIAIELRAHKTALGALVSLGWEDPRREARAVQEMTMSPISRSGSRQSRLTMHSERRHAV